MKPPNISPPNPFVTNSVAHLITIKLSTNNYILWKAQILPFLRGSQLYGYYVDGTIPIPSLTIKDLPNLEFTSWLLQHQLIVTAINSYLINTFSPMFLIVPLLMKFGKPFIVSTLPKPLPTSCKPNSNLQF